MSRTLAQRKQQKAYRAERRRRFAAAGLRSDGKPWAPPKSCGCLHGSCLKCRRKGNKGYWSDEEVIAMKQDYDSGMSRAAVERKHGVGHKGLQNVFERRGFKLRPATHMPKRDHKTGKIFPHIPKTPEQIEAMVSKLTRLAVPQELKHEWRLWSLEKKAAFVKRLRKKFPSNRPTTPFIGVKPFEYGSPRAHEIARRMNAGRNSRNKLIALKPCSEGVIWRGRLFFWDKQNDYLAGHTESKVEKGIFRALLKRLIYEQHFGPIAPSTLVIQKDGNKNNFQPSNLALLSRKDNAIRNKTAGRARKGTAAASALLSRFNRMDSSSLLTLRKS